MDRESAKSVSFVTFYDDFSIYKFSVIYSKILYGIANNTKLYSLEKSSKIECFLYEMKFIMI